MAEIRSAWAFIKEALTSETGTLPTRPPEGHSTHVRLFGVYVHVHKSDRGWGSRATMDTEASEGEDGGVLGV